jgi:hypothetical protein
MRQNGAVPDRIPWYARPWLDLVDPRRGLFVVCGYLLAGACLLAVAAVGGSYPSVRLLQLAAGVGFVVLAAMAAATMRWRRLHRAL